MLKTRVLSLSEVMDEVAETVPGLDKIVAEIEGLALSGGNYTEAPHVIEVTLPMLCRYVSEISTDQHNVMPYS